MKPPAERTRYRLCFELVIQCCTISPYFIAADLDKSRSKHNAEDQPPEQYNDQFRWSMRRKGSHVEQGTKKYSKETSFQELNLPSVPIPFLSHMYERHVKEPYDRHQRSICKTCH